MTTEEAKKEFTAAKLAPLLITAAFAIFFVAILVFDSGALKGTPFFLPALGGLWLAAFGTSMRRLRLAAVLVTVLEEKFPPGNTEEP
jgi:hypothetical protein